MHKPILRRVGLVLLLASLASLGWTTYEAFQTHRFSFDFTLLGASIALLWGKRTAADFVRRLAALALGVLACYTPYWILTEPASLLLARLRFETVATVVDWASYGTLVVLCAWTVRELSRPEVMEGADNRPFRWITGSLAFAAGVGLSLLLAAVLLPMANGKTGARAVLTAQAQLGSSFHYHLDSLSVEDDESGRHVSATVAAWTDFAVVNLPVTWDE